MREWFDARALPSRMPSAHARIAIAGLDYKCFKLFHLSALCRAGVSTLPKSAKEEGSRESARQERRFRRGDGFPRCDPRPLGALGLRGVAGRLKLPGLIGLLGLLGLLSVSAAVSPERVERTGCVRTQGTVLTARTQERPAGASVPMSPTSA